MEIVLRSDNQESLAKIIALAKELNVVVEIKSAEINRTDRAILKNRILNFKATGHSSFGDAMESEQRERSDRDLPFS